MKEITLPVSELKDALPGLSKIVGRSRTLPVLQSVRISRDQEGITTLQATDLDSFATYTAKEKQNGSGVVLLIPLDQLVKITKGLKAEDSITLIPEGKERVRLRYTLTGSPVEQNIGTLSPEEWPVIPNITQPAISMEPGFGIALKQALECCSDDPSRYVLRGACLDMTDKKFHYVVGTNGRALFSANSFCFDLKKSVIIPDSKFLNWTDLMDQEPCTLAVEPGKEEQKGSGKDYKPKEAGWIKLQSPRWTFITREIDGQYPNWKVAVPNPTKKWCRVVLSEEAIKQMLQVIPRLPGDDGLNKPIRLRADKHLIVEGRARDDEEWTSVPIHAVNVFNDPAMIGLNRDYLLRALKFGLNQLEIEDPLTPIVASNGGKKMVIMPVNLEPTPPPGTVPKPQNSNSPETQNQSQAKPETQPEERTGEMPRTRATTPEPMTTFRPAETQNGQNHNGNGHTNGNGVDNRNGNGSAVKSVVQHIEQIQQNLKGIIRDLNDVADALKQAEKEKRSTEKEIEGIRNKLLQIQKVTI